MGSMAFEQQDADGTVLRKYSFDSSPRYSLCKAHGYREDSFRLEKTGGDAEVTRYDVYGSATEGAVARKVGVLTAKTRDAIWAGR